MITLATAALAACGDQPAAPDGDIMASLRLTDLDGAAFDPEALRGKPAIVTFWRPGCPHCRDELPQVAAAAREAGATAVAVMVVGHPDLGKQFLADLDFDGPRLVDDGSLRRRYGIKQVPYTLIVRPDGTADRVFLGTQSTEVLAAAASATR